MSGTRALFASIGASVSLVAAAALSLLAVSAVFAFGGWSDPVAQSASQTALILADARAGPSRVPEREALVLPRRAEAPVSRQVARPGALPRSAASPAGLAQSQGSRPPKASLSPPPVSAPEHTVTPPIPAPPKPSAGDGVRSAGEGLSGKVQSTGDALAQLTDPLLPPVTAATRELLNAVAELLRRSTSGLGTTVDGL